MYPPRFDYYRANSVEEAVSLLQEHSGAKLLAGGHSLIPLMNLRLADPGTVIDIGRVDGIKGIGNSDGSYKVGALTTHAMVAAADGDGFPAGLREAAGMIGDPQVRNRGTVGGNVAHADPASDLPTILTALGATFHITGPNGSRAVPASDFFVDLFMTALQPGEILTAVEVPAENAGTGSAYAKLYNQASRFAMVSAGAAVTADGDGNCTGCAVAVGGLTSHAKRVPSVAEALVGKPLNDENIAAAAQAVLQDLGDDVMGDIHAGADYRRQMAVVYVRRALTQAAERARA